MPPGGVLLVASIYGERLARQTSNLNFHETAQMLEESSHL